MVTMKFNIKADFEDFDVQKFLKILAELIINRVKVNVRDMKLVSESGEGGAYLQGWMSHINGSKLTIENTQPYAIYLEYGTYSYWNQYGETDFPETVLPKKKDLSIDLRKAMPKGMQPFAPIRRVMYNENIMTELIVEAIQAVA